VIKSVGKHGANMHQCSKKAGDSSD
jgi:hypothetical protein